MDRALLARLEKTTWVHRHPRGAPLLLFLFTAMATFLAVAALNRADTVRNRVDLERFATEVAARVERRAMEQIAILHAASAVFALHETVTRQDFTSFGTGLRGSGAFHGPLQMGWAERVRAADIPGFEQARRASGLSGYKVFPQPLPNSVAFPIVYVDPWKEAYRSYIGYDLFSDPAMRAAMAGAAEKGEPFATRAVDIVERQRTSMTPGVLIFMPVFQRGANGRQLKGFAYSTIQASDLLPVTERLQSDDVQIALFDGQKDGAHLLTQHRTLRPLGETVERELTIANRKWILSVSMPQRAAFSDLALVTLLFGLVLSLLVSVIARMITRRAAEDRILLDWYTRQSAIRTSLSRELSHRVKNTLANVLSIVALTRRRSASIDDFAESLSGRLRALSATHDLLSLADWREASIGELVRAELAPYMQDEIEPRVVLSGPEVSLAPNDALSLGLAIHELATNAAKYGALSDESGRIHLSWRLETPDVVVVDWREQGGPEVEPPTRRGFGIELIEKIVSQELHSKVELQFLPTGVRCRLRVPVRKRTDFEIRAHH